MLTVSVVALGLDAVDSLAAGEDWTAGCVWVALVAEDGATALLAAIDATG